MQRREQSFIITRAGASRLLFFMDDSPPTPFVELRNVTFGYGDRAVLDGLSLTIPRGKVTALMGASGGGKTTVLRLIGGQQRAQ